MPRGVYERKLRPRPERQLCAVSGCHRRSRNPRSSAPCNTHYHRALRTGSMDAPVKPIRKPRASRTDGLPKGAWTAERRALHAARVLPLKDRLLSRVQFDTNGGCWLWEAPGDNGYGLIKVDGRYVSAHRASYTAFIGPIPDGLNVCHTCDVRACIRPDHLWAGTQSQNVRDAIRKGRWVQSAAWSEEHRALREEIGVTPRRPMTKKRRREVLDRCGHRCARAGCNVTSGLEIDHIICLALGGEDEDHNLEPLCGPHHREKTNADLEAIARARRRRLKAEGVETRQKKIIASPGFQKGKSAPIPSRGFSPGKTTWPKRSFRK